MSGVFTRNWDESLCVVLFTLIVGAAHAVLKLLAPPGKPEPAVAAPRKMLACAALAAAGLIGLPFLPGRLRLPLLVAVFVTSPVWIAIALRVVARSSVGSPGARQWLLPSLAFVLGGVLGWVFVLPAAAQPMLGVRDSGSLLWNATVGPGLILLAGPLSFRAARPRLPALPQPARRWVFLTPLLMLAAAVGTVTSDAFNLIVVFLPMSVAAMAGILSAEAAAAFSNEVRVPMTRILPWGARFAAECLLGAGVALAILWRGTASH